MDEINKLQETIKFYEERIKHNKKLYDKTSDVNFARYILAENEILEETLEALKVEYKKARGLL